MNWVHWIVAFAPARVARSMIAMEMEVSTDAAVSPEMFGAGSRMPGVTVSAIGLAGTAAPEFPRDREPWVLTVLPVEAIAVTRLMDSHVHWMPVITVVPVVIPTGVASVVGVAPAARKIVAVVDVAVVVRNPLAVTRNVAPGYRKLVAIAKSLAVGACGLIVAVTAVLRAVPWVVCHGGPELSRAAQVWLGTSHQAEASAVIEAAAKVRVFPLARVTEVIEPCM